jgi:hypothetical protein
MAFDWTQFIATGAWPTTIGPVLGLSIVVLAVAVTVVTGLALYKAARLKDKTWFWIMTIIHTMGILPAIYLYIKRKDKS